MKVKLSFLVIALLAFGTSLFAQEVMTKAMRSKTDPLKIGETAPVFSLTDENSSCYSLGVIKRPTVLVFYRGYW